MATWTATCAATARSFASFSRKICLEYKTVVGLRPYFLGADVAVEVDALAARPAAMWAVADAASVTFEARRADVAVEVDEYTFGARPAAACVVDDAASFTLAARAAAACAFASL